MESNDNQFKEITEEVKIRKTYFYPTNKITNELEKTDCVEIDVYGHNTHLTKAQLFKLITELQKILDGI